MTAFMWIAVAISLLIPVVAHGEWRGWIGYEPDETGWMPSSFAATKIVASAAAVVWVFALFAKFA